LLRSWAIDRLPAWSHPAVHRVRLTTVLTLSAILVAGVVVGVKALHRPGPSYPSSYSTSAVAPQSDSGPSTAASPDPAAAVESVAASIVVDVGGRVRKPGLVTLPANARVADALAAAGGPLHHKEIATLDLAARVSDGQLLLVGEPAAAAATTAGSASADGSDDSGAAPAPVSLSAATIDALETLPGVGPVTAQKIIDWRTAHGGFTSVEQLQQVSGIGPTRYAELSPLVTP
jgi:competence protein ComEA